jgi:hypothetical protein
LQVQVPSPIQIHTQTRAQNRRISINNTEEKAPVSANNNTQNAWRELKNDGERKLDHGEGTHPTSRGVAVARSQIDVGSGGRIQPTTRRVRERGNGGGQPRCPGQDGMGSDAERKGGKGGGNNCEEGGGASRREGGAFDRVRVGS